MGERDDNWKGAPQFTSRKSQKLKRNYYNWPGRNKGVKNQFDGLNSSYWKSKKHQNKTAVISEKPQPWSEEAKEEERKKQLSDTANKLMNKLKLWNAKKNDKDSCNLNFIQRCTDVFCQDMEGSAPTAIKKNLHQRKRVACTTKQDINNKVKKIAANCEQFKTKNNSLKRLKKSQNIKNGSQTSEGSDQFKTDNKTSLKKKQSYHAAENVEKKIQQKVIGELMTMPKENLKKVLVDPRIHPKIEHGMAQIVKENRLILAQKFRSLAESKISNQGQFVCSKFVDDIGSLIDPDLAIDLCQLPPEMIKQISDIFQLDFENRTENEINKNAHVNLCAGSNDELMTQGNFSTPSIASNEVQSESNVTTDLLKIKTEPQEEDISCIPEGPGEISYLSESCENTYSDLFNDKSIKFEPCALPHLFNNRDQVVENQNSSEISKLNIPSENAFMPERYGDLNNIADNSYCCNEISFSNKNNNTEVNRICKMAEDIVNNDETINKSECSFHLTKEFKDNFILDLNRSSVIGKNSTVISNMNQIKNKNVFYSNKEKTTYPARNIGFAVQELAPESKSGELLDGERKTAGVQTDISLMDIEYLRTECHIEFTEERLIQDIQIIDNLVHLLNRKKFALFLKLINLNSSSFNKNSLKTSLLQTVTNGDLELLKEIGDLNSS